MDVELKVISGTGWKSPGRGMLIRIQSPGYLVWCLIHKKSKASRKELFIQRESGKVVNQKMHKLSFHNLTMTTICVQL